MKYPRLLRIPVWIFLLFLSHYSYSQISEEEEKKQDAPNQKLMIRLSEQDVLLPITSLEWGYPDRWSFTTRYVHSFHKEKKRRVWHHSIGALLSPGFSGGRFGLDYLIIFSPPVWREFAVFSDVRAVLLRTWGNPVGARTNTTFIGAEWKICFGVLLNFSAGYYTPLDSTIKNTDPFWSFHFGVGI